jgi:uncharacterized protein YdeI (YjbR/CyaY-like superfamily)
MTRKEHAELEPDGRAAWRRWLADHHDSSPGVRLIWHTKASGQQRITLDEAVSEALCFGWIDSTVRRLGGGRSALLFTPRRPGGTWSRLNKQRVTALVAQGLMTEAGQRVVDAAKRDGSWHALDAVDDLLVPDDLATALHALPAAERNFAASPPSTRKLALAWIGSAKRPQTRATRIAETVRLAADNRTVADRFTAGRRDRPGHLGYSGSR